MSDDKQAAQNSDVHHIDPTQPFEVRSWADEFGVSVEQLHEAIAAVGTSLEALRRHLRPD